MCCLVMIGLVIILVIVGPVLGTSLWVYYISYFISIFNTENKIINFKNGRQASRTKVVF